MNQLKAIVTLDTGEKAEYIHIYEGDDIELLAQFFCERHEIFEEGKQFIIEEIQKQLRFTGLSNQQQLQNQISKQIINHCQSQAVIQKAPQFKKSDYDILHKGVWGKIDNQTSKIQQHNRGLSNQLLVPQKSQTQLILKKNISNQAKCHTTIEEYKSIQPTKLKTTRQQQINQAKRLIDQKSISEKRLQQMRFESNSPINMNFKPQITKDKVYHKVSEKIDKEDYQLAQMLGDLKSGQMKKRIFEQHSQKITFKQDSSLIRKIFLQLDGDNDGQISPQFINLNINHQLLEKISPVLCHMEEQHLILDFDSFSQLIRSFNILIF